MIKIIIKRLYKEWKLFGLNNITILRTQAAFNIQANLSITTSSGENSIIINATVMAVLSDQQSVCVTLDALFPRKLPLETSLASVCAFSQFASVLMAPLFFIVDLESHQLIVRQSQILATDIPFASTQFLFTSQRLIPLLYDNIQLLDEDCSSDQARSVADHLYKTFYGEMSR